MGDLKKKQTAEQVEGVGAWKSRQKVNKMFLARTIKVNELFPLFRLDLSFKGFFKDISFSRTSSNGTYRREK